MALTFSKREIFHVKDSAVSPVGPDAAFCFASHALSTHVGSGETGDAEHRDDLPVTWRQFHCLILGRTIDIANYGRAHGFLSSK